MREAVYRGKGTESGEWIYGALVMPAKRTANIVVNGSAYPVTADSVGQFTGMYDKNGDRIFEGDIIRLDNGAWGEVTFEAGAFGIAFMPYIDWDWIESKLHEYTGCNNRLHGCMNDNFISLWELYWNFNGEDSCLEMLEIV